MGDRIVLTADDGMVYTNGTDYGTVIYLAVGADPNSYWQITEEEYLAAMAAEESEEE
jgi:hypothetical protein